MNPDPQPFTVKILKYFFRSTGVKPMLLIGEDWSGGAEGRDAGQHHARARGEVRRHPRIRCQGQRECYRARAGFWSVTLLSTSRARGVL